jgi:hypothetical protein
MFSLLIMALTKPRYTSRHVTPRGLYLRPIPALVSILAKILSSHGDKDVESGLWVVTPTFLSMDRNISEAHLASIFTDQHKTTGVILIVVSNKQ